MNNKSYTIINLPTFLLNIFDVSSMNFITKLFFIIYGKLVQFVYIFTERSLFCNLINILLPRHAAIYFDGKHYYKKITENITIFYPNKRISRVISQQQEIFKKIFSSYCLEKIAFTEGDVVIDCGANVGELNVAFNLMEINVNYIGIEPDKETFECLEKNKIKDTDYFINVALSDESTEKKLFLDRVGGNSSIIYFGKDKFEIVKTSRLDDLDIPNKIKLLKLEAEGYEPEILLGAKKMIQHIEYVSVDFGSERGESAENTVVEVNKFLVENNFKLISFSDYRLIGLYQNNNELG